jgi:excisionase family DNA binding protein
MSATVDDLALLVTPEEAASRLRIGRSKVYELLRTGELRSIKIGGSRRITTEALAEFIAGLQEAS